MNDCVTGVAAAYVMPPAGPPAWAAWMVHNPVVSIVTAPPLVTVHTLDVLVLKVSANPDVLLPLTVNEGSKMLLSLSTVKVIVWSFRDVNDCVTLGAAA
jgi:hypothetical protein